MANEDNSWMQMSRYSAEWQAGFKKYLKSVFGAHIVKEQLHVLVLDVIACLIEVKRRFGLTWH
jgi:hypothetical protein